LLGVIHGHTACHCRLSRDASYPLTCTRGVEDCALYLLRWRILDAPEDLYILGLLATPRPAKSDHHTYVTLHRVVKTCPSTFPTRPRYHLYILFAHATRHKRLEECRPRRARFKSYLANVKGPTSAKSSAPALLSLRARLVAAPSAL
jgi:hypothetical protein